LVIGLNKIPLYIQGKLRDILELWRTSELTKGIILVILVGVVSGLGAVIFRWAISGFDSVFFDGGEEALGFLGRYYVILIPALGGLLVGPLIYFFAREAKGHGVPEVMLAVAATGGRIRARVAAVKTLASSICIGSGGSVGREGPIVQIGSSVGSSLGQWFRLREEWVRLLVACGAAGGISATFNAPIAGIFFSLELILRQFNLRNFIFVGLSSITATTIARAFLGDSPSFTHIPEYAWTSAWEIPFYILLGVIAAFVAWGFVRALYKCEDLFNSWRFPEYLKPAFGGIAIGLMGLYYSDLFGVGYEGMETAILGGFGVGALVGMGLLKILATSFTIGSGGSGGVFAPSLFMGAMLGSAFGVGVHTLFPTAITESGAYGLVGMGAVFAAAAHAPITAILILFEMTRDYLIIVPLMLAVVVSTFTARRLSRESIYTMKVKRMGIEITEGEVDPLKLVRVRDVMTRDFPTVSPEMPIKKLLTELEKTGHHGFPVVDQEGCLYGCVTLSDVEAAMKRGSYDFKVRDIAIRNPVIVYPDQTVHEALLRIGALDVGRIPVVDRNDPTRLLGVLRRHDIVRAYTKAVPKRQKLPPRQQ
jgi:CIC family chloride channel protein